jgi:hypothetical protein
LLSVSASLGFVELRDGRYQLTPLGEDYLVESSPTYFGSQWQIPIGTDSLFTIGNVEKAVLTNSPQTYGGTEWMKSHEENSEVARSFARSMHSASMAAALAWPEKIDLANCQTMFDIGGGSGALYRGRRTLAEAKGYRSGYRAGVRGRQRNGGEERPRRQNRHSCGGHVERSVPSRGRGRNNT